MGMLMHMQPEVAGGWVVDMLMYMQPEVAESAARWSKNRVDRIERGEMAQKTGENGQKTRNLQKTKLSREPRGPACYRDSFDLSREPGGPACYGDSY